MAGFSWFAGSMPALSIGKIGNSSALAPVFPLLLPVVNGKFPEFLPNSPRHPAKPATISCLMPAKSRLVGVLLVVGFLASALG
jgi:hypothetical protein